jgi:hypothetical protein
MADPIAQLAPPVGPQAPQAAVASVQATDPLLAAVAVALLLAVLAALVFGYAWRSRWTRGLTRAARAGDAARQADALAALARRHAVQAPSAWWAALDRVRFGPPAGGHDRTLTALLAQARGFVPRDTPAQAWRRGSR